MRPLNGKMIGNILILASLSISIVLGYPLVMAYLFPPPYMLSQTPSSSFRIAIPKIHANAPIIPGVDPWNMTEYNEVLKHGVAQAKGTGLPGQGKTIYLFAHSSGLPWEQIYFNTIFLRLGELEEGDKIIIDIHKKRYTYTVYAKKEVWPNETKYLEDTTKNQLILQTCTPIGTSLKRLLVFAQPQ